MVYQLAASLIFFCEISLPTYMRLCEKYVIEIAPDARHVRDLSSWPVDADMHGGDASNYMPGRLKHRRKSGALR
jgi:hypothetical protein